MSAASIVIWLWAASIVMVWVLVAIDLGQPLGMRQHSIALTAYGAFQGREFSLQETWKLLASQWLHVRFPHMLFNACVIGLVGTALSSRLGWRVVLVLGLVAGGVGQATAAILQPDAYVSGASQAYLALCGTALLLLPRQTLGWWTALVGTVVSVGLDLFVSDYAAIKPGHLAPFAIGLVVGFIIMFFHKRRVVRPIRGKS